MHTLAAALRERRWEDSGNEAHPHLKRLDQSEWKESDERHDRGTTGCAYTQARRDARTHLFLTSDVSLDETVSLSQCEKRATKHTGEISRV